GLPKRSPRDYGAFFRHDHPFEGLLLRIGRLAVTKLGIVIKNLRIYNPHHLSSSLAERSAF
ncbi:hypothetical protein, partial [Pseudomonas avellanae]|uniref:hypothetical protein n=1 Tax=Pseudomonas avellanae TaxID=46257 RepID=UPI001ED986DA